MRAPVACISWTIMMRPSLSEQCICSICGVDDEPHQTRQPHLPAIRVHDDTTRQDEAVKVVLYGMPC